MALSLIALMHFITDEQDAHGIVRRLVDTLPPGSYLVLSHAASDLYPELAAQVTAEYAKGGIQLAFRSRAEVERFFDGLDLVPPGLVTATEWSASAADARSRRAAASTRGSPASPDRASPVRAPPAPGRRPSL